MEEVPPLPEEAPPGPDGDNAAAEAPAAARPPSPASPPADGRLKAAAKRVTFPSDEDIVSGAVEPKDPWRHGRQPGRREGRIRGPPQGMHGPPRELLRRAAGPRFRLRGQAEAQKGARRKGIPPSRPSKTKAPQHLTTPTSKNPKQASLQKRSSRSSRKLGGLGGERGSRKN